jgi:Rieske Fe-S protein
MTSGIPRRSALTATAAVAVGAVAGFVYGRSSDAARAGSTESRSGYAGVSPGHKLLARLAAIPVGSGLITSGVVLSRDSGNVVHAFSSTCTHLGCTVNKVSNGKIFCPCHGSVFDAVTGAVVQGPASKPLSPIPVTVQNGGVYTS